MPAPGCRYRSPYWRTKGKLRQRRISCPPRGQCGVFSPFPTAGAGKIVAPARAGIGTRLGPEPQLPLSCASQKPDQGPLPWQPHRLPHGREPVGRQLLTGDRHRSHAWLSP